MRVVWLSAILGILGVSAASVPLYAQEPERRPSAAIFGAPDPRLQEDPPDATLSLAGFLFGAYDDTLVVDPARLITVDAPLRSRGAHLGFSGGMLYERAGDQAVRASVASTARYYPDTHRFTTGRQNVDLSASSILPLWDGARLRTSGMGRYARYAVPFAAGGFLATGLPADMFDGDDDVRLRRTDFIRGQAQVEQAVGARRSIGFVVGVQTAGLEGSDRTEGYELGGLFSNQFGRYGTLRFGYTHQEIGYTGATYLVHHLDLGGNYTRPISATRRAYVSVSGGSAILESNGERRMQATGDAALLYEFGRSWRGSAHYRRGFTFVDEIVGPLLSDGVVGEVSGLLSRRLELEASGSFTRGTAGLSRDAAPYDVYGGRTQARFALSRVAAIYAEYLLFKYQFHESVRLGAALPPQFDRHTIRAGVTVLTQLLH